MGFQPVFLLITALLLVGTALLVRDTLDQPGSTPR